MQVFARLADSSYQNYRGVAPTQIEKWRLISSFSDKRATVYFNNGIFAFNIRGTIPTNIRDLWLDKMVIKNKLKQTLEYQNLKKRIFQLSSMGGIIITGHSLGASLGLELMDEVYMVIDKAYLFNYGSSYRKFLELNMKRLACSRVNIFRNKKKCKLKDLIKDKIVVLQSGYDPISILSRFSGHNVSLIKAKNKYNPHSLSNFTS